MKYSSIPVAQTVIYHCKANGIRNIVISPGSRNAPLIIGFTSDSFFNCFSIVDERCAAFFALGIAQQLKEPVVVVCTSGSALLNFYPAVAEAFYSDIPLIVISADRPEHKIDIGDGQTIRQQHIYKNHIGYEVNLKLDISHATSKLKVENPVLFEEINSIEEEQEKINAFNEKELHKGLIIAIESKCPIHINAPFEEPLYDVVDELSFTPSVQKKASVKNRIVVEVEEELISLWNTSSKKIVLVGVLGPNEVEQQFLDELGTDPSVIVFTETTSNLHHPNFFESIDSIIVPIEKSIERGQLFQALQPDILLTFGGLVVSKKINFFLRKYQPKHHWHVDAIKANNTFFCLSKHFKVDVNTFFNSFSKEISSVESSYFEKWSLLKNSYLEKREAYLKEIPFSDFQAFSILFRSIPQDYQLQLTNSSTVRYAQLFNLNSSLTVFLQQRYKWY